MIEELLHELSAVCGLTAGSVSVVNAAIVLGSFEIFELCNFLAKSDPIVFHVHSFLEDAEISLGSLSPLSALSPSRGGSLSQSRLLIQFYIPRGAKDGGSQIRPM